MGNGGGKCASREQSARSSRPPRLRSKRRETLVQASTSSVALKPSSSKEKAIEFDPATLVPVIGKVRFRLTLLHSSSPQLVGLAHLE